MSNSELDAHVITMASIAATKKKKKIHEYLTTNVTDILHAETLLLVQIFTINLIAKPDKECSLISD